METIHWFLFDVVGNAMPYVLGAMLILYIACKEKRNFWDGYLN